MTIPCLDSPGRLAAAHVLTTLHSGPTDELHSGPTDEDEGSPVAKRRCEEDQRKKVTWTDEEDRMLERYVEQNGPRRWASTELPGRTGKQCRERWFQHLAPEVSKGEWTAEEDRILNEGSRSWAPSGP